MHVRNNIRGINDNRMFCFNYSFYVSTLHLRNLSKLVGLPIENNFDFV